MLVGCAANQRKELYDQLYPTWPENIQQAVDSKQVILGMNEIQVQISTGVGKNLIKKSVTTNASGVRETWKLYRDIAGWSFGDATAGTFFTPNITYITFNNGIVESITSN